MERCEAEALALKYVSGELEDVEKEAYGRHLSECPVCRQQLQKSLRWADALIFGLSDIAPPTRVLKKMESQVAHTFPRRIRPSWVIATVLVTLVVGLGLGRALNSPQSTVSPVQGPVVMALEKPYPGADDGQVMVWKGSSRLAITVAHLPKLSGNRVYEAWVMGKAAPKALGRLHVTENYGWFTGHGVVTSADQVVICVESNGWAGRWPGRIVLSTSMRNS